MICAERCPWMRLKSAENNSGCPYSDVSAAPYLGDMQEKISCACMPRLGLSDHLSVGETAREIPALGLSMAARPQFIKAQCSSKFRAALFY